MKQVLLIGSKSSYADDVSEMRELQGFLQELLGEAAQVSLSQLDNLVFLIEESGVKVFDNTNNRTFDAYDFVFLRGPKMRILSDLAYYVSRACAISGIPHLNDYSQYYPGSKVAQTFVFYEHQAAFLKTVYSANKQLMVDAAKREFGFPFILKDNVGSHGDSNYLVRSEEELRDVLQREPDVDFLAQEFCPNDRDFRLLIAGDSHLIFERRGSADTHLNNTSKGGQASASELPETVIAKAKEVSESLGLAIAGADVMPHLGTGTYYFLEINSQPQLRTGALLDEKKQIIRRLFTDRLG